MTRFWEVAAVLCGSVLGGEAWIWLRDRYDPKPPIDLDELDRPRGKTP